MEVMYFSAPWCGPCKVFGPVVETVTNDLKDKGITLNKVILEDNPELVQKYGIRSVPTVVLLNDEGVEVNRKVGAIQSKQLQEFIVSNL